MPSQQLPRRLVIQAVPVLATSLISRGAAARDGVRVGMIPDAGSTQISVEQKAPLRDYLAKAMGQPVDLIIPTNYNATVEGLGNDSLDFAYLGGLTYIKAHARYGVLPIVQRDSDRQFHALFIAHTGSNVRTLRDLKGRSFAFGDINSTSGHLMPYAALQHAGINPDADLKFRYTGSHPATAKAVEAGVVDAGAVDESVYHAMLDAGQLDKSKVYVFYTTPPFVDYVWAARRQIDVTTRNRFAAAFLGLHSPRDDKILDILRGKRFVKANDSEYDPLRHVAKAVKLF